MNDHWTTRTRTRFLAVAFVSVTCVFVVASLGAMRQQNGSPVTAAELWLSWSVDAREEYVWGFLDGFQDGKRAGCTYYADKITPYIPHEPRPPEKLPRSACFNELPNFPQQSKQYVDALTAYYKKYPNDRQAGMRQILSQLASPPGLTIDEIHMKLTQGDGN